MCACVRVPVLGVCLCVCVFNILFTIIIINESLELWWLKTPSVSLYKTLPISSYIIFFRLFFIIMYSHWTSYRSLPLCIVLVLHSWNNPAFFAVISCFSLRETHYPLTTNADRFL